MNLGYTTKLTTLNRWEKREKKRVSFAPGPVRSTERDTMGTGTGVGPAASADFPHPCIPLQLLHLLHPYLAPSWRHWSTSVEPLRAPAGAAGPPAPPAATRRSTRTIIGPSTLTYVGPESQRWATSAEQSAWRSPCRRPTSGQSTVR
jgi:hypothetical protein